MKAFDGTTFMRYVTVHIHYSVHLTQLAVDILSALEGCGHLRFTEAVSQLFSQPNQFDSRFEPSVIRLTMMRASA